MPYSDTTPIEKFSPDVSTTPLADKLQEDRFLLDG